MLDGIKKTIFTKLAEAVPEIGCPKCGHRFRPYAGQEISSLTQLNADQPCPACGFTISPKSWNTNQPPSAQLPAPRPPDTQIEVQPISNFERIYQIPRTGKSGGLLLFTVFWNLISWAVAIPFIDGMMRGSGQNRWMPLPFILLFPAIGLVMIYITLRQKYATHLLYLGSDRVRLRRELFGRITDIELATCEITEVHQAVFYTQNYQPVHGIEILAGSKKIRFGSSLSQQEKLWLCHDIYAFLFPEKR